MPALLMTEPEKLKELKPNQINGAPRDIVNELFQLANRPLRSLLSFLTSLEHPLDKLASLHFTLCSLKVFSRRLAAPRCG